MKLTVQLLTWNGEKYIPHLFESLRKQTYQDWQIYILDNGSIDGTVSVIKQELKNFNRACHFEEGKDNLGFAGGHNYIYDQADTEYAVFLNQDLYLEPDCFEKMISFMDKNPETAVVSPRLMKWNFNSLDDFFSDYVDSLGLKAYKNRRVVDWMAGKNWKEESSRVAKWSGGQTVEVFGVSGTVLLLRRKSADNILYNGKFIFDPDYGSYKEDVDLAFRLRSAGNKAYVILDTCAYHDRASNIGMSAIDNKKRQPMRIKYNSYRNHIMTIYKNEYWQNFIIDFLRILCYETGKFAWFLIFDRGVLKGWKDIWKLRKELRNRRREIKNKRKIGWREMRKWL
ncbi:MAG: hypothetical protein A2373_03635 [Candidatus Magasanikbacteria bacterium RIFOXYB1_FULL_40_15]|uniref:Glycosyltransferase 2-like domain-containing protein n=1 Tax=Candidatus Magasanikbacteria bacterium RIFOXYB1_FULL_40_15 TaxID=1798697 RepID=A0A1F6NEP4_9BACT|nr:MAG: hypothetical protein A2373_03635 [Candidatus Magasanikbacteria bacterium RIFOXYB1_FULL_40_15]